MSGEIDQKSNRIGENERKLRQNTGFLEDMDRWVSVI